jgi:hypothetical protein
VVDEPASARRDAAVGRRPALLAAADDRSR